MKTKQSGNRKPSVGVIGLGRMGSAIAARLARRDIRMAGWTRSGIAARRASELGITASPGIAALADASDILVMSLTDDAAVIAVLERLSQCDLGGKLVVDTSTVSPDTLRSQAEAISRAGGAAIDAPISGGPEMVLSGKAGIFVGGDEIPVDRFMPVARSLSDRVYRVGGLGDGAAAKIVNNMMLIGYWQCLKEALQVGKRAGLSAETMLRILSESPAANGALAPRIPIILGQSDDVGFTVSGVVKDVSLFTRTAERYGVPVPAVNAAFASFKAHRDSGHGEADLASMVRAAYSDV